MQNYFNAGMRGTKTTLWEGGHRVPCFLRWPGGNLAAPRDISELSHVQDLLPTLADLAGVAEVPKNLDGASLAPLFRAERDRLDDRMLVINYSRMPQFKVTYTDGNPAIPQRDGGAVLWRHWRLLENRRLYDLRADPHQDRDVAADHPEIVACMQAHLDQWWQGVRSRVLELQRVVIGSEAENPMLLTACEWLDVFVDQQVQVRRGERKHGIWHLHVARPGEYRFELRRWPRESGLKLSGSVDLTRVTDGEFPEGVSLPIQRAWLRISDHEMASEPDGGGECVVFHAILEPGDVELETSLLDADGTVICGAYYVYVSRLQ